MANLFELLINKTQNNQPQDLALVDEAGNKLPAEQQLENYKPTVSDRFNNVGNKINEGLFGKIVDSGSNVNDEILSYQNYLRDKGFDEKTVAGVPQGLNSGNKDIANWIYQYNNSKIGKIEPINIPNTPQDIALAKNGQFNSYPASGNLSHRTGGFLNDLSAGWQDNTQNGFNITNLMPDKNKGFAYRLGEGLGTTAKFLNSPLGRGLIAGGLVAATGGGALPSLTFGTAAAAQNQQNVVKDKLYRDRLNQEGINTNNVNGYISDDTYMKLMQAKQLEEQRQYREMVLNNQILQNNIMNSLRQDQLNYTREKDKEDKILKREEFDYKKAQDAIDNYFKQQEYENKNKDKTNNNDLVEIEQQLKNFEATFDKVPNKLRGATEGAFRRKLGLASVNEANFDAQRTLLFNMIARKLGGEKGVLSDQDIKRIEKALPTLSDSYEQRVAKMKAVYDLLNIKKGSQKSSNNNQGWAF